MIVFPTGGEQQYNANLIEYLHTGINFSAIKTSFGKKEMKEAICRLSSEKRIRESIRHLSEKHKTDGAEVAYNKIIETYRSNLPRGTELEKTD